MHAITHQHLFLCILHQVLCGIPGITAVEFQRELSGIPKRKKHKKAGIPENQ